MQKEIEYINPCAIQIIVCCSTSVCRLNKDLNSFLTILLKRFTPNNHQRFVLDLKMEEIYLLLTVKIRRNF